MIGTDLSKQQALDFDPKAIQEVNLIGNLENNAVIFFIIEDAKDAKFKQNFPQETVKVF